MADIRVLWVSPSMRSVKCGETYTEEQLRDAGMDPDAMVANGEAELASPKPKKRGN